MFENKCPKCPKTNVRNVLKQMSENKCLKTNVRKQMSETKPSDNKIYETKMSETPMSTTSKTSRTLWSRTFCPSAEQNLLLALSPSVLPSAKLPSALKLAFAQNRPTTFETRDRLSGPIEQNKFTTCKIPSAF
jgi:hypothetical protein